MTISFCYCTHTRTRGQAFSQGLPQPILIMVTSLGDRPRP